MGEKSKKQELFTSRVLMAIGIELRQKIRDITGLSVSDSSLQSLNLAINKLCEKHELKKTLEEDLVVNEEPVKRKVLKI